MPIEALQPAHTYKNMERRICPNRPGAACGRVGRGLVRSEPGRSGRTVQTDHALQNAAHQRTRKKLTSQSPRQSAPSRPDADAREPTNQAPAHPPARVTATSAKREARPTRKDKRDSAKREARQQQSHQETTFKLREIPKTPIHDMNRFLHCRVAAHAPLTGEPAQNHVTDRAVVGVWSPQSEPRRRNSPPRTTVRRQGKQ